MNIQETTNDVRRWSYFFFAIYSVFKTHLQSGADQLSNHYKSNRNVLILSAVARNRTIRRWTVDVFAGNPFRADCHLYVS